MTTTEAGAIAVAADRLASASRSRKPCAPIRDLIGSVDIAAAYRVQSANLGSAMAAGRRVVGRKIGLTSRAVQSQLGVDQPDFGFLLDDMDCTDETEIPWGRLLQPRIEAEVAFTLARDVREPLTAHDAPSYVADVIAAFEIVDSRVADWDIEITDTVADNASSGLYVLGSRLGAGAELPDLETVEMMLTEDGVEVSRGTGADCLGSPWNALAWLANTARSYGSPLLEGDLILSGSLGPLAPVRPGAAYVATISGVGSVSAVFSE
ncbi:fumarylacetoacetate hydrolase family protein [Gordonia sp. LSe1-13]|uniref:Fumarylacetoacetate hydrolase family protein n=1 Tax=Gordonia sesuvii TaxID=3116777 RepID=A0ABU7M992_9ACTN|nr:fumarylacetoacetate hydrolase family protein [Gordonia sp. LSe1-13]